MGPIPHHMHQSAAQAKLVGQEGKPESYYFPPQHNNVGNNFPYTFMGLEPGTTKAQVRDCIAKWNKGDNGILDLSKAYRLKPGTGWLIDPCILHAPGSLCTYEPQWGSDVFGMYQNLVEGREVPWSLLVKDMPKSKHQDIDFIVDQLDWDKNVDPELQGQPLPRARPRRRHPQRRLRRSLDRLRQGRRRAVLHRQGNHHRPRHQVHGQGHRRLRPHLRPRLRQDQRRAARQPEAHPLPRAHRRRVFLHRRRRQSRRHIRKHQQHRAARLLALLRPRSESRRPENGRLPQKQILTKNRRFSRPFFPSTPTFIPKTPPPHG